MTPQTQNDHFLDGSTWRPTGIARFTSDLFKLVEIWQVTSYHQQDPYGHPVCHSGMMSNWLYGDPPRVLPGPR